MMKDKIQVFKNEAYATFEKCGMWYVVQWRKPNGEIGDKMRCDTYRSGLEYYRAFKAVAKNYKQ